MKSSILIFAVLVGVGLATYGVDISQPFNNFSCFKDHGVKFAIMRGWCSYGASDPSAAQSIANAKQAGIKNVDVYYFPCSHGKTAKSQAVEFANNLNSMYNGEPGMILASDDDDVKGLSAGFYPNWGNEIDQSLTNEEISKETPEWRTNVNKSYGMVWVDVEINPSRNCGWGTDYSKNCQFLVDSLVALKGQGLTVGVYSSNYMWETVMGSQTACPEAAKYTSQYWYAHYDNKQTFSDFKTTGGWTKPSIKQYAGDVTECNMGVDKNFY